MAKEVILTPIALSDFDSVVEYLTYKWGLNVTNDFIERFDKVSLILSEDPSRFPFFDITKQIQKCLLTKHNVLLFQEKDQVITILTVFDTRQDPKKLRELLK